MTRREAAALKFRCQPQAEDCRWSVQLAFNSNYCRERSDLHRKGAIPAPRGTVLTPEWRPALTSGKLSVVPARRENQKQLRCWQAGEADEALTVLWCGKADGARAGLLCGEADGALTGLLCGETGKADGA